MRGWHNRWQPPIEQWPVGTRVTEADRYRAYILLLFSLFWVLERKVVDLFCGLLWCVGYNNLIHTRVRVMCKISIIWRKRVTSDFPGRQWPQAGSRAGPHTSRSPSQHLLISSPTFTREKQTQSPDTCNIIMLILSPTFTREKQIQSPDTCHLAAQGSLCLLYSERNSSIISEDYLQRFKRFYVSGISSGPCLVPV